MNAMTTTDAPDLPACDTSLRFVRVMEQRPDGLVSFEFSIGWPELAVELMLPAPAFEAFCASNKVQRLDT
ncbi:MAG: phenol hydroxylase subunit [Burkholderiaceae bacterium]